MVDYVFPGERKSETFSLSSMPRIPIDSVKLEIKLSESHAVPFTLDDVLKEGRKNPDCGDANAPLCPFLPNIKRNRENKVALMLETDSKSNMVLKQ